MPTNQGHVFRPSTSETWISFVSQVNMQPLLQTEHKETRPQLWGSKHTPDLSWCLTVPHRMYSIVLLRTAAVTTRWLCHLPAPQLPSRQNPIMRKNPHENFDPLLYSEPPYSPPTWPSFLRVTVLGQVVSRLYREGDASRVQPSYLITLLCTCIHPCPCHVNRLEAGSRFSNLFHFHPLFTCK